MKRKILFAEDDQNLGFMTSEGLMQAGYEVDWQKDGEEAWKAFSNHDLCLIDIMMPRMNGFSLAEKIRDKDAFIPILFLTAKSREEDRLKGFEIGGDDYISKPFSMKELVYRLKVFERRSSAEETKSAGSTIFGNCSFSLDNLSLQVAGQTYSMTQREGDLLQLFLESPNSIVKREDILVKIWGENDYFMGRSLDVFISRLRKYLKEDDSIKIKNHHGVGFVLSIN